MRGGSRALAAGEHRSIPSGLRWWCRPRRTSWPCPQPRAQYDPCALISPTVRDSGPIQGELQNQIMATLWRLGDGSVEDVRSALPSRYRGAYTTVQTVLNRLVERGLVSRQKVGKGFRYRPAVSEEDYLSRSIAGTLANASRHARRGALARLIGNLNPDELSEIQRLAAEIDALRRAP